MANQSGYISGDHLITNACQAVGDASGGRVGRPRYKEFLYKAMVEMFSDIPYDERHFEAPITGQVIKLPEFITGFNNLWVFNGESCSVEHRVRVHQNPGYYVTGEGGAFSNNNGDNTDDLTQASVMSNYGKQFFYYFGFDQPSGCVHLSPSCLSFQKIHVEFTGTGFESFCQEEELRVPIWCSEAIEHYVCMRAAQHLIHIEGKSAVARDQYKDFKDEYKSYTGSWINAKARWAGMDQKERIDLAHYFSRLGWPI